MRLTQYLQLSMGLLVAWASAGAFAQAITLAHIAPFTGPAAQDAKELNEGIRAALTQVNDSGGIGGRRLELLSLDDRFGAAEFAKQFAAAQSHQPVAVLSPLGLDAMHALLEGGLLDRYDATVVNAAPGATPFRVPGHPRLFHVRAGDRQQIEKMLLHASVIGIQRITAWVQDRAVGEADVRGAQQAHSETRGLALRLVTMPPNPAELGQAAHEIAASDAQAVIVIGSPPYTAAAITALRKANMHRYVYALSYLPPPMLVQMAGVDQARGVAIAQTFPNPMGNALPVQRTFQAAMHDAYPALPRYSAFHFEGYLTARVAVEGLRHIQGTPSPQKLADALRRFSPIDLDGFRVDFSHSNAGGSHVDIGLIDSRGRLIY